MPVTVTHDIYGRRLCVECREPGTPLRKMLQSRPSAPSPDDLQLRKLWRVVSVVTKRRALLLILLPTARTPRYSVCERRSVMRWVWWGSPASAHINIPSTVNMR
jgi:hypothetical protein